MTKIDPRDLRPGQRVRVTFDATVDRNGDGYNLRLRMRDGSPQTVFLAEEFPALTCELLPDPIKVGDRVRRETSAATGTVLAVHAKSAWVSDGYPTPATWQLAELIKIEGDA